MRRLWLSELHLGDQTDMDALVTTSLALELEVFLPGCSLSPASVPALVRLLGSASLRRFCIWGGEFLDHWPHVLSLREALRASSLTTLSMHCFSAELPGHALALLGALVGHPTLAELSMDSWVDGDGEEVLESNIALTAVLGHILGADPPSLRKMDVPNCGLDETALTFLLDGLVRNTHLTELVFYSNSAANNFNFEDGSPFVTDQLLPAVQRCPSLRLLYCNDAFDNNEAERLVAARAAGVQ